MKIHDFLALAYQIQDKHPAWRWGQTLFNTLQRVNPDLAEEIRATDLDTFYTTPDSKTEHKFWEWLAEKEEI